MIHIHFIFVSRLPVYVEECDAMRGRHFNRFEK